MHRCDEHRSADPLDAVRCAAHQHREAREAAKRASAQRIAAFREARDAGVTLTAIAATTGMSVPYIHQLVHSTTDTEDIP